MDFGLIAALVVVVVLTMTYKFIPYRLVSDKKPSFALLPKYKKSISISSNGKDLESKLESYGFKKSGLKDDTTYFVRGSLLGDFSVKLLKVKLGVKQIVGGQTELTLEAGWLVAFDTGDFWTFITELSSKLENA